MIQHSPIYLTLLLSLLFLSRAQAHETRPTVWGYTIRRYTDENGLPQNSIKAAAPDAYGFVWLATESGVVRFDGKDFRTYGKAEIGLKFGPHVGLFARQPPRRIVCPYR